MKVTHSITVACGPDEAFALFTEGIDRWWPLKEGFSFGQDRCASIHLDPQVGGRFYERFVDGDEYQVGTVLTCEPPARIVFSWEPPVWSGPTEVEVRFAAGDEGTTVHVEHRGFESLGAEAEPTRDSFGGGWATVLARFAEVAAR